MKNIGITSLWEDLDDKLLTPGQLQGYPWKLCGITVQTSYVEGGIKIESAYLHLYLHLYLYLNLYFIFANQLLLEAINLDKYGQRTAENKVWTFAGGAARG